jgi:hypothetical protein
LYEPLIRKALTAMSDFPATEDEFNRQLQAAGIVFSALRDSWRRPLAVEISHVGPSRNIEIKSAGPDGKWNTSDDVSVADFQGTYFSQTDRAIRQILNAAQGISAQCRSGAGRSSHGRISLRYTARSLGPPSLSSLSRRTTIRRSRQPLHLCRISTPARTMSGVDSCQDSPGGSRRP